MDLLVNHSPNLVKDEKKKGGSVGGSFLSLIHCSVSEIKRGKVHITSSFYLY